MSTPARTKSWNGDVDKHYPPALATHDEVISDPIVFWDTLRRFHFVMNTKFMIPVIGGKELDLHVLYSEVTRRGGHEKVVAEKKWREVGGIFKFSPTTTSASFVLRKHYLSLLYHYEQVYLFGRQGPICAPQGPFLFSPSIFPFLLYPLFSISDFAVNLSWVLSFSSSTAPLSFGSPTRDSELAMVEYTPKTTSFSPAEVTGTIDGKFDCGYLVTVKLGSEVLRGVLYHPDQPVPSDLRPQSTNAIIPYTGGRQRHAGRRHRRRRRKTDPNHPKPNRSGYNFFFAEKHYKLKSLYPNREREFTKMIGESWNKLSPEERMVYQNIGLKDKERYKRELKEYKEKMRQATADIQATNCSKHGE
ncbi:high mobility group B protein 9-like isoform X1 [Cucurbita moschata]|uniref:High mobility group B protein 9-like isoform X1 n=1 Tax=Cucurbita moschata TaxID=3662 RepID=A0A6J1FKI9_CUCMO|nr:high mobility group B protein 9-like isoform X1 [Cucurbita moschata]XP_022940772.1 high mobility group B protein 9-like isoform X1 [Cucurbita moschata]